MKCLVPDEKHPGVGIQTLQHLMSAHFCFSVYHPIYMSFLHFFSGSLPPFVNSDQESQSRHSPPPLPTTARMPLIFIASEGFNTFFPQGHSCLPRFGFCVLYICFKPKTFNTSPEALSGVARSLLLRSAIFRHGRCTHETKTPHIFIFLILRFFLRPSNTNLQTLTFNLITRTCYYG